MGLLVWLLAGTASTLKAQPAAPERLLKKLEKSRSMSHEKPDSALLLYQQILAESAQKYGFSMHVKVYHNLGIFFAERSQYEKALSYADSALKYIPRTKENKMAGKLYNLKANVYMQTGRNEEAQKAYLLCISMAEKEGNDRLLLMAYSNISVLYNSLIQYEKGLEYARKQFQLAQKIDNKDEIAFACAAISDFFSQTHQPDSLEKYARIMKEACAGTEDPSLPLMLANITGAMHLSKQEFGKAIPEFKKAIALNLEQGDSIGLIRAWINLGIAFKKNRKGKDAVETLEPAVRIARKLNERMLEREATKELAESYSVAGLFEKAYQTQCQYQALSDEALNKQSQENLQNLEARYQTEKKEAAIRLLTKDNALKASEAEQRKSERNLILLASLSFIGFGLFFTQRHLARKRMAARQAELESRLRLSSDLHDDVGATLSSISIYTEAIKNKLRLQDYEKVRELVEKIGENAQETVSTLGDIVWNLNPVNDSAERLFMRMESTSLLLLAARNARLEFEVDPQVLNIDFSLEAKQNIYLMFKETVNNTVKYSGANLLKINIKRDLKDLELKMTDNGTGFDVEEKSNGNGLANIRRRAKALGGKAEISSSETGTITQIRIPLSVLEKR